MPKLLKKLRLTRQILLFFVILLQPEIWAHDAAAEDYITGLQSAISELRTNLPALTKSAEQGAKCFLSGGNLWAAGRQPDFIAEASQRAGGLMSIAPLAKHVPASNDVILYAVPGSLDENDRKLFEEWRRNGAMVVSFSSPAGLYQKHFPLDTVLNVAEMWMWTGEFVAACTRSGKMPVLYESYGLPGGFARAKKYRGTRFHDDLSIPPIAEGVLGNEYADQIQRMLAEIHKTEMPKMDRAAEWWGKSKSATVLVTGHMFPEHSQDPRSVRAGDFVRVSAREDKKLLEANPSEFVFYLGYQFPPQKLLGELEKTGVKLVYSTVQAAQPAEPSDNIIYIAPVWPLADGCVRVPGYDVPILPGSGVVQAAIYWTIASKAFPDGQASFRKQK